MWTDQPTRRDHQERKGSNDLHCGLRTRNDSQKNRGPACRAVAWELIKKKKEGPRAQLNGSRSAHGSACGHCALTRDRRIGCIVVTKERRTGCMHCDQRGAAVGVRERSTGPYPRASFAASVRTVCTEKERVAMPLMSSAPASSAPFRDIELRTGVKLRTFHVFLSECCICFI